MNIPHDKRAGKTIKGVYNLYSSYLKNKYKVKHISLVVKYITRISCAEFAHL